MMTSFLESLVMGLSISSVALLGWWLSRRLFIWRESRVPLTPNCLLTKYPVLIVTEQTSPWKFWSAEERARHFLMNHGYMAAVVTKTEYSQWNLRHYNNHHHADNLQFHAIQSTTLNGSLKGIPSINLKDRANLLRQAVEFAEREFI